MVVKRSELTWFARELTGRWRVLAPSADGPHREHRKPHYGDDDLRYSDAVHEVVSRYPVSKSTGNWRAEFVCDECRHVVARDDESFFHSSWDSGYEWSEPLGPRYDVLREAIGDHRHDEGSFVDGWIRFYTIMATGPWKVEQWSASWTEVFGSVISRRGVEAVPATPKWVYDHHLLKGVHDHGMSGGIEYPGHALSDEEYMSIRQTEISEFGRLDMEVPEFRDPTDFLFYTLGFRSGRAHGEC